MSLYNRPSKLNRLGHRQTNKQTNHNQLNYGQIPFSIRLDYLFFGIVQKQNVIIPWIIQQKAWLIFRHYELRSESRVTTVKVSIEDVKSDDEVLQADDLNSEEEKERTHNNLAFNKAKRTSRNKSRTISGRGRYYLWTQQRQLSHAQSWIYRSDEGVIKLPNDICNKYLLLWLNILRRDLIFNWNQICWIYRATYTVDVLQDECRQQVGKMVLSHASDINFCDLVLCACLPSFSLDFWACWMRAGIGQAPL